MRTRLFPLLAAAVLMGGCASQDEDPASNWPRPAGSVPAGRSTPIMIPHPGRDRIDLDTPPMDVYPRGTDAPANE